MPLWTAGIQADRYGWRVNTRQQVIVAVEPMLSGLRFRGGGAIGDASEDIEEAWVLRGIGGQRPRIDGGKGTA